MNNTIRLFSATLIALAAIAASAPATHAAEGEKTIAYADYLYTSGEYYRAITEYRRFLYFYPGSGDTDRARLQIGLSYMQGRSYNDAVDYWRLETSDEGGLKGPARLAGQMFLSMSYFDLHSERPFNARKPFIADGLAVIDNMQDSRPEVLNLKTFAASYREQEPELERKSKVIAGGLSAFIPGAGSAYSERYVEATYTFIFTALFLYATLDSQRSGQTGYVPVFAFFTLAFYGGGIYAAVNSAERYNSQLESELFSSLRAKHNLILPQP